MAFILYKNKVIFYSIISNCDQSLFSNILSLNVFLSQGFLQQLRQIAGRMGSGPRGAGLGLKLLFGAGALAYGVKEATYTGNAFDECFAVV